MGRHERVGTGNGWPKWKPCLGHCNGMHLATHAGDRLCEDCRSRNRYYGRVSLHANQIFLRPVGTTSARVD